MQHLKFVLIGDWLKGSLSTYSCTKLPTFYLSVRINTKENIHTILRFHMLFHFLASVLKTDVRFKHLLKFPKSYIIEIKSWTESLDHYAKHFYSGPRNS